MADLEKTVPVLSQVLETLGSETMRPSTAAQCVAYIACTELPLGAWPEMMPILTSNVTNPASTEMVKEASLEAVGYICQDIVCALERLLSPASLSVFIWEHSSGLYKYFPLVC